MPAIRPSIRAAGALSAALACTVWALACGGEEEQQSGPPATVAASQPVEVVAGDYFFDPSAVVVEGGGGSLEIVLDNQGAVAHNLTLFDGEEEVGATPTFAGGEERSATVELGPGAYRMVCTVADHEELGMVGELEVR